MPRGPDLEPKKPTVGDYQIGWICALSVEMAAAEALLDFKEEPLKNRPDDQNTYIFGRMHQHNIVITCLPSGVYGTTAAAHVAVQMKTSFPALRSCLLVGIGGGAPSSNPDIRLGDVVVSKPTASYAGVIQYDYGKAIANGEFVATGILNKPPMHLLSAITRLQSFHHLKENKIPGLIKEALTMYPQYSETCSYPGQESDILFESTYQHNDPEKPTCKSCDKARITVRAPRTDTTPRIFYGLIASANQVMRDSNRRETLSRQHGILCFEMEAAGIMDVLPCLVIRGISDYSDSHKSKQWQGYAAATAAAYAKELLSVVVSSDIDEAPSVADLDSYQDDVPPSNYMPSSRRAPKLLNTRWDSSVGRDLGHGFTNPLDRYQAVASVQDCPDAETLVIAIDLGTRFTRVGWATADAFAKDEINFVTVWPGCDREEFKVPTAVCYTHREFLATDKQPEFFWGYNIPKAEPPFYWLWFLEMNNKDYDEETPLPNYTVPKRERLPQPLPNLYSLHPRLILTDYLRTIWDVASKNIALHRGQDFIKRVRLHVAMTLPTAWEDKGRLALGKAAEDAGILGYRPGGTTQLSFVFRHEAAAIVTLRQPGQTLRVRDQFVVCYAGGRRVDVSIYKIIQVDPLKLQQSSYETWGFCGGDMVDSAFQSLLEEKLRWTDHTPKDISDIMAKQWEPRIKRAVRPQGPNSKYTIALPDTQSRASRLYEYRRRRSDGDRPIQFSNNDIERVFMQCVSSIQGLIENQLETSKAKRQSVKGIILAGGLGLSPYLYDPLKSAYDPLGLPVLRVNDPLADTTACQGAIYQALFANR
ncbi:hypothetical protein BJX66DRAFT_345553 [Aspergillus keveii]|uniref:Nucleoside phosphorylase domain-containing protein n=1 Tax=Aspergillus keveii TaxID=714993 RepID=A0ABR4FHP5_9EURO